MLTGHGYMVDTATDGAGIGAHGKTKCGVAHFVPAGPARPSVKARGGGDIDEAGIRSRDRQRLGLKAPVALRPRTGCPLPYRSA